MIGLMVLAVYALFWWFCWFFSGLFIKESTRNPKIKRVGIFLIPALLPVHVYLVEYVLLQQACKEAVVYFPEEKHKIPDTLITGYGYKNQGRYFDGMFKYIVSPHHMNNRPVDLNKSVRQFDDYIVYPYKAEPLEGEDRKEILAEVRYAFIYGPTISETTWFSHKVEYFVYDFLEQKKISRIVNVLSRSRNHNLIGYFRIKPKACSANKHFKYKDIIKNTFIMENK